MKKSIEYRFEYLGVARVRDGPVSPGIYDLPGNAAVTSCRCLGNSTYSIRIRGCRTSGRSHHLQVVEEKCRDGVRQPSAIRTHPACRNCGVYLLSKSGLVLSGAGASVHCVAGHSVTDISGAALLYSKVSQFPSDSTALCLKDRLSRGQYYVPHEDCRNPASSVRRSEYPPLDADQALPEPETAASFCWSRDSSSFGDRLARFRITCPVRSQ